MKTTKKSEFIKLKTISGDYDIPAERIKNQGQLLGWIDHVCSKRWATSEHIRSLIYDAEENCGIEIDREM